jgi:chaperonin GroEL
VGTDGGILTEKAPIEDIECEFVDGYYLQSGFQALQAGKKELSNPIVLVAIRRLTSPSEIVELLSNAAQASGVKPGEIPRVVFFGNIEDGAYTHICNLINQGIIDAIVLKTPPQFGEMGKQLLEDIAAYASCKPITDSDNLRDFSTAYIGSLDKVVANKSESTLFADNSTELVTERIALIRSQAETEFVDAILEKLHDRISKLEGKIALFRIGAATDTGREEVEFRVEDAIHATRAAAEHGVVPGGGTTLLAFSKLPISDWYKHALESTFQRLLTNANMPAELTMDAVLKAPVGHGVNLRQGPEVVDLVEVGILDPSLVVEQIIKNATEAVANALTIGGATIFDQKED